MNTLLQSHNITEKILFYITLILSIIVLGVFVYSISQPAVYVIRIPMLSDLENEQRQKDDFMKHCPDDDYCECAYNFTRTFYNVLAIQRQNNLYHKAGILPDYLIKSHEFCNKYY